MMLRFPKWSKPIIGNDPLASLNAILASSKPENATVKRGDYVSKQTIK